MSGRGMATAARMTKMDEEARLDMESGSGVDALFDLWQARTGHRPFPDLADFEPRILADFRRGAWVLDVRGGLGDAVVRYSGPDLKGRIVPDASLAQVFETGLPLALELDPEQDAPAPGVLLPVGKGSGDIAFILGFFEIGAAAVSVTHEKASEMQGRLQEIHGLTRDLARSMARSDIRHRKILFRVLARVQALYHAGLEAPCDFEALLRHAGLKRQARAPFTPVIKLAFGKTHDKTRITEYAAALSHAERHGIGPDAFEAFLENIPGGLKGCVAAEREARRQDAGRATPPVLDAAKDWLRGQSPIAEATLQGSLPDGVNSEFVLLFARRAPDGPSSHVNILEIIEEADVVTEKILKKIYHRRPTPVFDEK